MTENPKSSWNLDVLPAILLGLCNEGRSPSDPAVFTSFDALLRGSLSGRGDSKSRIPVSPLRLASGPSDPFK